MTLKIHAFPLSPRSFKVLWTANHLGLDYTLELVDFSKGAQRAPEYLALNPNGRAPVIEHDAFVLWESDAILEYFVALKPQSRLLPEEARARAAITKWLFWESAHWDPACVPFAVERVVKKLFGRGTEDPAEIARGTELFKRVGEVLDGELAKHRFIAGDALTVADFAIGATMCIADQAQLPLEPYRNIQRWRAEIEALPSWAKTRAMQLPTQGMAAE
jgi:glutathione S-transferase